MEYSVHVVMVGDLIVIIGEIDGSNDDDVRTTINNGIYEETLSRKYTVVYMASTNQMPICI